MMVVEYGGRIVVVDTGLMFPAPDQLGIDLILPRTSPTSGSAPETSTRSCSPTGTRTTWAPCRSSCGSSRHAAGLRRPLTAAMVRSKLDEHRLKDVQVEDVLAGQTFEAGPFSIEMIKMAHSIPDAFAVALTTELGTMLMTGDYKFDQTPVDGVWRTSRGSPSSGARDSCSCAATPPTRTAPAFRCPSPRSAPAAGGVRPPPRRIVVTCFASNIHRVQQVVDAAASLDRRVSLIGARCARTRTSAGCSGTSTSRRGCWSGRRRSRTSRTTSS